MGIKLETLRIYAPILPMPANHQLTEDAVGRLMLEPRKCESSWLVDRAIRLRDLAIHSQSSNLLVLACLETRNAIEQLWFEILMVIKGGTLAIEEYKEIRRKRDGFRGEISKLVTNYHKLVTFTAAVAELVPGLPATAPWDFKTLIRCWTNVSNFCHTQAAPDLTINCPKWFAEGLAAIDEATGYMAANMAVAVTAIMNPDDMKAFAREIWNDFEAGHIDSDSMKFRLTTLRP